MNPNLLFIDFESFYDSKQKYDLKNISVVEYVRDPRFQVHGLAYIYGSGPSTWRAFDPPIKMFDLDWAKTAIVAHNAKFDAFIFKEKYGIQPVEYRCTKAMAKAVLGKRVKDFSLRTLAEYFGLEPKGQMKTDGIRDLTPEQEKELAEYSMHDVWLCREIYKRLEPEFPVGQYFFMDQTIRMFVNPKLKLNVHLLEKTAEEEKREKERKIEEIGIEKTEFASNQKFASLLKNRGYEVPSKLSPRTKKSIPALALGDPEFVEMLESENEELKALCETRKAIKSTLLETRAGKLAKIGKTGLWPFDVEFSGATQTHRYSGGNGAGGNPQNFTRDSALRQAVEAPEGYKLVVGDFNQIEARLVATLSKDPGLLEAFKTNPYVDAASSFYGRKVTKYDPITGEETPEYRFGKIMVLGLGYGMGWKKFQKMVKLQTGSDLTEEDAKKAVDLYRKRYYRVPLLWKRLDEAISAIPVSGVVMPCCAPITVKECLVLPSHLRIRYPNLRQEPNEKGRLEWVFDVWDKNKSGTIKKKLYGGMVLENICQALAGEICKLTMKEFPNEVVAQVHDEIILCVPEDQAESYAEELQYFMEQAPDWLPELKLKAEIGIGKTWASAKHG